MPKAETSDAIRETQTTVRSIESQPERRHSFRARGNETALGAGDRAAAKYVATSVRSPTANTRKVGVHAFPLICFDQFRVARDNRVKKIQRTRTMSTDFSKTMSYSLRAKSRRVVTLLNDAVALLRQRQVWLEKIDEGSRQHREGEYTEYALHATFGFLARNPEVGEPRDVCVPDYEYSHPIGPPTTMSSFTIRWPMALKSRR
jgi:hypothetical protein